MALFQRHAAMIIAKPY